MSDDQEPKIFVDSDWKAEAQAEKDRLSATEQAKDPGSDEATAISASMEELIRMMATQALMYLGAIPDPASGKAILSPEYARLHIDMLGVIEEKTKGNLTDEEEKMLTGVLSELRMQFVQVSQAVSQAIAEGKLKPEEGGGSVPPQSS